MPLFSILPLLLIIFFLANYSNFEFPTTSENNMYTAGENQLNVKYGGLPSVIHWELKDSDATVYLLIETNYYQEFDQLAIDYHRGKKRCQTKKGLVDNGAKNVSFDCTGYRGHHRYARRHLFLDIASVNIHCGNKIMEQPLPETFLLSKDLRWLDATLENNCDENEPITHITVGKQNKFSESARKAHLSPKDVPNRSYDYTKPLQECLTDLGFDVGTPNGIAGAKTRKGIKEFQRSNQILDAGEVDVITYIQCWDRSSGWESVKEDVFNSVK